MPALSVDYDIWQIIVFLLVLIPETVSDIHKMQIHPLFVLAASVLSLVLYGFYYSFSILTFAGNICIGLILIVFSLLFKGKIGMGDGIVFLFVGCVCGFWKSLEISMLSFVLAAVTSIVLIVLKRANKDTRLSFVPYVLLATLVCGISLV